MSMSTYIYVCLCQEQTQTTTVKSSAIKQTQTGSSGQTSSDNGNEGSSGQHGDTSSGQTSSTPGSPTPLPEGPQPPASRLRPGRPPPSASRQRRGPTPTSSAPTRASLPSTELLGRPKPYVYRYVVWVPYYLFPLSPKVINMGDSGEIGHLLPLLRRRHIHCSQSDLVYCASILVPSEREGVPKDEE